MVISLAAAWVNRGAQIESGILTGHYIPMAEYLRGDAPRAVLTYPMWGYPLVLALIGWGPAVIVLQVAVASLAAAVFCVLGAELLAIRRRWLVWCFALGIPWYALHTVKWPASFAASFALIGVTLLGVSLDRHSRRLAAVAGVAFGLALNFRSEWLLALPVFGLACIIWRLVAGRWGLSPAILAIFVATVTLCLAPWAIHCKRSTGALALTSSNAGMVLYISLGQLPGNPWGIVHADRTAMEVTAAERPDVAAYSVEGSRILLDRFWHAIKRHPVAFLRKTVRNLTYILAGGFYSGEPGPSGGDDRRTLEIAKEKLKKRFGLSPNVAEIARYRASGDWDRVSLGLGTAVALAFPVGALAIGVVFVLTSLAGMVVAFRRLSAHPFYALLASMVLTRFGAISISQYQPRHLNGIFPYLAPFFVLAIATAAVRARADFTFDREFRNIGWRRLR